MTQPEALKIMLAGHNVFLTGAPGSGKTYVINQFIEQAERDGKNVAITASTGLAASLIGGTTIHSWSGIGIRDTLTKQNLAWYMNQDKFVNRFHDTDVLVIDEVSMLHSYRLDMVSRIVSHVRKDPRPFGGMQVILVGDLFQLPPVTRRDNNNSVFSLPAMDEQNDFVYKATCWSALDLKVCYLTEQHRQGAGDDLLRFLTAMRQGFSEERRQDITDRLQRMVAYKEPKEVTKLYSHNVEVDAINRDHLNALKGKIKSYRMETSGKDQKAVEALVRNLLVPENLELKAGAKVMFVANDFDEGFVNGTQGIIEKFDKGKPVVRTTDGNLIRVTRHTWQVKVDERVVAEAKQLPLRLAWAITIHKSQGMSLDNALVDLSKAFMPGMGYVALSRVRSLSGLYLRGINDMALRMNDEIFELDAQLRALSDELCRELV